MNWKTTGKILFFAGAILVLLTFLWEELILRGAYAKYIGYTMNISWGLIIIGILAWFSQLK
ncbi:MAG: hypothetical protein AABW50_05080 [Nanoarchaeota archaeon]